MPAAVVLPANLLALPAKMAILVLLVYTVIFFTLSLVAISALKAHTALIVSISICNLISAFINVR